MAGLLRWPTCTYFGSRTISSASRTTSSGIVAEKSSVCRIAGIAVMIRRTSGQNPMSIIRSASSSTSSSTPLEVGVLLTHVVHQPPRRGDDDVDAGFEGAFLHAHLDAAVDRRACDRGVIGEPVNLVFDLHRELARRGEDQHAALPIRGDWLRGRVDDRLRRTAVVSGQHSLQDRHDERAGLARARFGARDDIAPLMASGMTAL